MTSNKRALAAFVLLAAVMAFSQQAGAAGGAKIVSVKGSVKVILAPGKAAEPAKAGMALGENAEIITGPGGEAMLSAGGGAVKVKPFSSIKIAALTSSGTDTSTVLSVKRGGVTAKVDKMSKGSTFSVKTPTAVAGVRGTQFSVDVAKAAGPSATLTTVKGKVELKKAKTAEWVPVKTGDRASKGDTLRTGPDGSCVMAWGKGNVVMVKSLTQLTVNDVAGGASGTEGKNELYVATGKAMVSAKKSSGGGSTFSVRTPTAIAGVRGTKFAVNVPGGDPTKSADVTGRLMDVKGKVEVLAKGTSQWKTASNNTAVKTGDTIRTGPGAACVVGWGKGNVVRITALASVRLDMMNTSPAAGTDDNQLFVSSGQVFVKAKKIKGTASTFTIRTPTAVAGVRGTEFAVNVKGGNRADAGEGNNAGGQGQGKAADSESKAGDQGKGESNAYGQKGGGGTTPGGGGTTTTGGGTTGGTTTGGSGDNTGGNRTTAGEGNNAGGQGQGKAADSESKAGEQGKGESNAYGQGGGGTTTTGGAPTTGAGEGAGGGQDKGGDADTGGGGGDEGAQGGGGKTEVVCMEGEVAVASPEGGDEVPVMQGEKMGMDQDGMQSDPEPVPQQEMAEMKSEASLENQEFTNAGAEDYPQEKPGATELSVSEGEVEVGAADGGGDKVMVEQGEKADVADGGQVGDVKEMSPEEKTEIESTKELDDPANQEVGTTGEEAPTTVKVLEGEVNVETPDGAMIDITAGMKADVEGGGAPAPQATPMTQEEIKTFKEESAGIEQVSTSQAPEKGESTTPQKGDGTTPQKGDGTTPQKGDGTTTTPDKSASTTTDKGDGTTTSTTGTTTTGSTTDSTTTSTTDSSTTTTTDTGTTDAGTTDTTTPTDDTIVIDTTAADAVLDTVVDQTTSNVVDNVTIQNPTTDVVNELACPDGSCINVHIEF